MPSARPRASGASTASRRVELPEYQPTTFSLNDKAISELARLKSKHSANSLEQSLANALAMLSDSVAAVNDNYVANVEALAARRQRVARAQDPEEQDEERIQELQDAVDALHTDVDELSKRIEENVRRIIDTQHDVEHITTTLDEISSAAAASQTQQSQRPNHRDENDDEEDGDDGPTPVPSFNPTDPTSGTQASPNQAVSIMFTDTLKQKQVRYKSYTLAERYATNNSYREFRKLLHDAQHPDQDVPMPHQNTWFATQAPRPAPGETGTQLLDNDNDLPATFDAPDDPEDDDIAIERVVMSTRCPISLRELVHPVTSKHCAHTFEREAIHTYIHDSTMRLVDDATARTTDFSTLPGAPPGQVLIATEGRASRRHGNAPLPGVPANKCPLPGCENMLTVRDLAPDALLNRQIARLQRDRRLREEMEDEVATPGRKRRRNGRSVVELGSSDVEQGGDEGEGEEGEVTATARRRTLKAERRRTAGARSSQG